MITLKNLLSRVGVDLKTWLEKHGVTSLKEAQEKIASLKLLVNDSDIRDIKAVFQAKKKKAVDDTAVAFPQEAEAVPEATAAPKPRRQKRGAAKVENKE